MSGLIALSIDLGGSHAACAVVRDGAILANRTIPLDRGNKLAHLLPKLNGALIDLLDIAKIDVSACAAVVLGFCGIVDSRKNRVLATNAKYEDAKEIDLEKWSAKVFGLPLLLENDARLALLGESRYGAAKGAKDAVMVTIGTGIGGAALLDGRLICSHNGLAGSIGGHLPIVLDGRRCSCGNVGCAEAEASTTFLPEIYRERANGKEGLLSDCSSFGFLELFNAFDAGDAPAIATLMHCLQVWSTLTVALIHAYDPEVVVFGGSVLNRAGMILPHIEKHVSSYAWTFGYTVSLRVAALGGDAAVLGAIPLMEIRQSASA